MPQLAEISTGGQYLLVEVPVVTVMVGGVLAFLGKRWIKKGDDDRAALARESARQSEALTRVLITLFPDGSPSLASTVERINTRVEVLYDRGTRLPAEAPNQPPPHG